LIQNARKLVARPALLSQHSKFEWPPHLILARAANILSWAFTHGSKGAAAVELTPIAFERGKRDGAH
jgi:hypothetical protein